MNDCFNTKITKKTQRTQRFFERGNYLYAGGEETEQGGKGNTKSA